MQDSCSQSSQKDDEQKIHWKYPVSAVWSSSWLHWLGPLQYVFIGLNSMSFIVGRVLGRVVVGVTGLAGRELIAGLGHAPADDAVLGAGDGGGELASLGALALLVKVPPRVFDVAAEGARALGALALLVEVPPRVFDFAVEGARADAVHQCTHPCHPSDSYTTSGLAGMLEGRAPLLLHTSHMF